MAWVTEITQVAAPFYFADEQRVGPYALWHHEHHFRAVDAGAIGGVEAIDVVHWSLPLDLLSWPVAMYVVSAAAARDISLPVGAAGRAFRRDRQGQR